MEKLSKRQANKAKTADKILQAAFKIMAKRGESDLTIQEVVRLSGVPRATVYQHYKTRAGLLKAATERFSTTFYDAVLTGSILPSPLGPDAAGIIDLNARFADFVMDNPELCRIWLFELLTSANPANDPIWMEYEASFRRFFKSGMAQDGIDSEVMTMLVLSSGVLWPVWARAHKKSKAERRKLSERYIKTMLRLSMWGSLKPECFPEVAEFLTGDGDSEPA